MVREFLFQKTFITVEYCNIIHIYSGITSGRVPNGELLYTKILEVNLFAFAYRLFHDDFSSIIGDFCKCKQINFYNLCVEYCIRLQQNRYLDKPALLSLLFSPFLSSIFSLLDYLENRTRPTNSLRWLILVRLESANTHFTTVLQTLTLDSNRL